MEDSALSVLQIEDSPSDAALCLRLLEKAGWQVCAERVESASALRQALQRQRWDLVLADYYLPGFDATQALEMVQNKGWDIPFIVVSGMIEERAAVELMRLGAHDFLMKSDVARLVPAVRRELAEAQQRQARREAQAKAVKLGRLYAMLSACNEAMLRCGSQDELFVALCRTVVQNGGACFAWIGLVDGASGWVKPVAHFGTGEAYLHDLQICTDANSPFGQGPTGIALRQSQSQWVENFGTDGRTAPWHAGAALFGWVASAALPLTKRGKTVGTLNLYSVEAAAFDADIRDLLERMAADISYALDNMTQRQELMERSETLEHSRSDLLAALEEQRDSQLKLQAEMLERQKAEQSLRSNEKRFRLLIEKSLAGKYMSRHGRYVYTNPRLDAILGYAPGELVGMPVAQVVLPEDLPVIQAATQQLKAGGESVSYEARARCKNGTVVELGVQGVVVDFDGERTTIGMVQDIGERKRTQAEINNYIARLEQTTESTLQVVAKMVELRDPYTAGHQKRVGDLAAAIGQELGLSTDCIKGLRLTGYVHDIGKISVPAELLSKPTRLTPLEFELIKTHAESGYDILRNIDFPWPLAEVIWQHHERPDGSGYPRRLQGAAVIKQARVMAVADVVEAMASHRPYRAGLGIDKALAEIEQGRGTRYDSAVADACLQLFRVRGYRLD